MLARITIKNLALIADAELEFSEKLNVLSGETGAGKSIIVDALMLLMGGKYDKTMLSYGADGGFVEGLFSFAEPSVTEILRDYGIEPDSELIVRRKFFADGRNDIRVNGKGVTAKMLRTIMSRFVDICGQNEYQILGNKREHGVILDKYLAAELAPLLAELAGKYAQYSELKKKIAGIGNAEQRMQRIDILAYQVDELERAAVREGEEEELVEFRNRAAHVEKIKLALGAATDALAGDDGGTDKIYEAVRQLAAVSALSSEYAELHERLSSVTIELNDIADTLSASLADVDFDEADLERAESRLQQLRGLKRKYGELSALPQKLAAMKEELESLSGSGEEYEYLCEKTDKLLDELYELSRQASEVRRKGAEHLESDVGRELATLGMKNAAFKVAFAELPPRGGFESRLSPDGADDMEFMLSPNLGQPLLPLIKIISGGEMSRFMLALKVIASKYGSVDTMIFDEIDTGISGKIGQEVAKKLAEISRHSQVLCVTHLPQIASMADYQYYIEKNTDGVTTSTSVCVLDREGMIGEIARLSGAGGISAAAEQSAAELKKWSDDFKKNL